MNPATRAAFDEAGELGGTQRAAYLHALLQAQPQLHAEVAALLEASDEAGEFLVCAGERAVESERVGPFLVTGELGRGGFSVVQRASQQWPVRREVALKRLSGRAGGLAVAARFEAERQTLAALSHPHIARFFDAGTDALGQPWFAMELVEGVAVTTFVRGRKLTRRAIIALFVTICDAITYAHRQGVIHRDLKPSNLLVDAAGHARVIDFGIAKVLEPLPGEVAEVTVEGQMMGTPLYMAPERFEGISDTRVDVYALGILLSELLTGRALRQVETFWKLGPQAWARHLRQTPAPAPGLERDLDAVLLKAVEADPDLRYGSVQEFAGDLLAWLDHQPVRARRPSAGYYAGKFVRRHRLVFGAVTVALAGLVTGLVLALDSAAIARDGRAAAELERDRALGVTEVLSLLISSANPELTEGAPAPTMAEALERFSAQLPAMVRARPLVEQDVRLVLGEAWLGQGRLPQAEAEFHRAIQLEKVTRRRMGEAWQSLAVVAMRRNQSQEAARILALPEANAPAGSAADPLNRMLNLCLAAHVARHNGDLAGARSQIASAMEIIARENFQATQPGAAAKAWRALAWLEKEEKNLPAAEQAGRELVALEARAEPPGSIALAEARGILAEAILARGDDPAALAMLEEAWRTFAGQYGQGHAFTLSLRLALAEYLHAAGRQAEAWGHARAALEAAEALPANHPERLILRGRAGALLERFSFESDPH